VSVINSVEGRDDNRSSTGWWALIGPIGRPLQVGVITTPHDRTAVLGGDYELGPTTLRPGESLLKEFLRTEPHNLAGFAVIDSYPIIVEGTWARPPTLPEGSTSPGEQAYLAERAAAQSLHRVVCLLSLAWGEPFQVRTSPKPANQLPPAVPRSWSEPELVEGFGAIGRHEVLPTHRRDLPEWANAAWDAVEHDPALQNALTFWHQGLLLTSAFPSFALVAIAACIEAIAGCEAFRDEIEQTGEPCPTCGNVARSTARFWATMGLVGSPQELKKLRRDWDIYKSRSKVAHGVGTRGVEDALGPFFLFRYQGPSENGGHALFIDEEDLAQRFLLQELPTFTRHASLLLQQALGAE
jgi:hypothetical protein